MKIFLSLAFILIIAACNNPGKVDGKAHQVAELVKDDPTFLRLKDTAQSHLKAFTDSLANRSGNEYYRFAVKSDFVDGNKHEHMWTVVFRYKDEKFAGLLIDTAFIVKNIKTGAKVYVKRSDVEDWMIYDGTHDKVYGNFSEKYLKSKL